MKETSAFIDTAEKIQEDFEEREEHLDKVESIFEKLKSDVATFKKNLTHTQFSTYPNVNYFTDVIHHYNTYSGSADRIADLQTEIDNSNTNKSTLETKLKNKKKELIELEDDLEKLEDGKKLDPPKTKKELEEEIEELEKEIEDMEKSIKSSGETVTDNKEKIKEEEKDSKTFKEQAENKASEMHTLATRIISNLEDISSRIQKAKDLNEDIQNTIDEANADASNDYGNAEDIAEGPPDGASSVDNLEEAIRENSAKLEEYPYDSAFFNSIKEPIDKAITRMKDVPGLFEAIETDIDLSSKSALQQIKKDALAALNPSIEDIDSGSGTLEDDRKEFKETDEAVTDQQEQQARIVIIKQKIC
ncbi:hypothetical protein [Gracilibacillus sp. JCM 18860]|uniref:hypothetical protein n=1 Tax=Gracilibacillus sp. JCM 18860 TaxID=1306159 RepID=UPI0006D235BD